MTRLLWAAVGVVATPYSKGYRQALFLNGVWRGLCPSDMDGPVAQRMAHSSEESPG